MIRPFSPVVSPAMLAGKVVRGISRKLAGTITHVATHERLVALTFDDGPDPDATPALLELLHDYGAKATFFVVGEQAVAHPELLEGMKAAGHFIGNHSWSHPSFPLISRKERREQILRCADVLQTSGPKLFRPPYGHQSALTQWEARQSGYHVITWNVCIPDWEPHDGVWLANLALRHISSGSIVLMHDGLFDYPGTASVSRSPTLEAVERLLHELAGKYEFVTVPELWRHGKPVRENWWMRPDVGFLNQLTRKQPPARKYPTKHLPEPWWSYNR